MFTKEYQEQCGIEALKQLCLWEKCFLEAETTRIIGYLL